MKFEKFKSNVIKWALERKIIPNSPFDAQYIKLIEELDGGKIESYMTGNIEINFKQINIFIQRPKKYFTDEKIGFLYEIIAFLNDNRQNNNNAECNNAYEPPVANYEMTETEEIPF